MKYVAESSGKSAESHIVEKIRDALSDVGAEIGSSLLASLRSHVSARYPGSRHWNPGRINISETTNSSATAGVDVPGASRAYRDLDIRPVRAGALTIPIHRSAYGRKASSFNDLFAVKTGKNSFLCRKNGSSLAFLYVLKDRVRQKRDPSLLPTDDTLATGIFSKIEEKLSKIQI